MQDTTQQAQAQAQPFTSAAQFRRAADKIVVIQIERSALESELERRLQETRKQFLLEQPTFAKLDAREAALTERCTHWIFADPDNAKTVLETKASGSTKIATWKIVQGKEKIDCQPSTKTAEAIAAIEENWPDSGGAIRQRKELAKSVLATWNDQDLQAVGLRRIPPQPKLVISPK